MKIHSKQQGMSAVGWLLTIAFVGFFAVIMLKLLPVYFERLSVNYVIGSMEDEIGIGRAGTEEIIQQVLKRLRNNRIETVTRDHIYVTEANRIRVIELEYEVRRNLLGNHDIVISYHNRIEVPAQ